MLLELLNDGALTLTAVCLQAPHLTPENHPEVLAAARHKTKRDVELLVATLRPRPPVPATVRKLPAPKPKTTPVDEAPKLASAEAAPRPSAPIQEPPRTPAVLTPLAPECYKLQVTVSAKTYARLRRAQDLLRHVVPNGDPAVILDRALTLLVDELERKKGGLTDRPRKVESGRTCTRHIPATVRRRVWQRDGGRCAFIGTQGRCAERGFLEFHHVVPYADGGETVVENLELRCRAHNAYEDARWNGALFARECPPCFGPTNLLGPDRARHRCQAGLTRGRSFIASSR